MFGLLSALVATLAFSINAPLAYAASRRGVSSQALVAVRNAVALVALLPLADFKIGAATAMLVAASALLGPGLGDYAYFKALTHSGVATAVTVSYTYIFTAQLFATALGLEGARLGAAAGALLAFAGIYIALGGRPRGIGVLYGAAASLSWGVASALLGVASREASPYTIAVVRSAVLAPLFSLFTNFNGAQRLGILYAVLSGVVGLAIGSTAFIYAMSQIGVAATVIATSLTPILSQILDRVVNKSEISPKHILGAALVGLGIAISVMSN
ncbi:MAG: EamA family transporter [Pyrobaculum sp.]